MSWARIGLANVATLMALVLFGFWEALTVLLLRVFLGSLASGTLLSPIFPFVLGGGLASLICMGLVWRYLGSVFSVV